MIEFPIQELMSEEACRSYLLKALHPDLQIEFRDLDSLDRTGKLLLLDQMRDILGIRKLTRTTI